VRKALAPAGGTARSDATLEDAAYAVDLSPTTEDRHNADVHCALCVYRMLEAAAATHVHPIS
jgi:hypothetical protein